MTEFTYDLPDPLEVLKRMRVTLRNTGEKERHLAELLEGASIDFQETDQFGERWHSYWLDVHFNVRPEALSEIDEHQEELENLVEKVIPAKTGYDVRDVDVVAGSTEETVDLSKKSEKLRRGLAEQGYWQSDKERIAQIATAESELVCLGPADKYPDHTEYEFRLKVHSRTFAEWRENSTIRDMEKTIKDELRRPFDVEMPKRSALTAVTVGPKLQEPEEGWEEEALRFAMGDGINNQGRAHSQNVASLEHDFLRFRSQPEIYLYRALKRLELPLAPLPVFVQGGDEGRRVEPDFFVLYRGMSFVIEVDGTNWHEESPAEAYERLDFMTDEGVKEFRVEAGDCSTPEKAKAQAKRLREKMIQARESF